MVYLLDCNCHFGVDDFLWDCLVSDEYNADLFGSGECKISSLAAGAQVIIGEVVIYSLDWNLLNLLESTQRLRKVWNVEPHHRESLVKRISA